MPPAAPPWLLRQLIRNLEHVPAGWLELDLSAEDTRRNSLDDTPFPDGLRVEVTGGADLAAGLGPDTIYSGSV